MDQNVKQCSDFAVYFYQIRWFDITAFAFKAPKVQEVVEITASGPIVCKYYKLYIQQISFWPVYGRIHNVDFAVYFYQIRYITVCKAPISRDNGLASTFANIINQKFHNDLACIRAVMDQNVKQCSDFAVYFYQIRWFDITAFAFKAPKVQEVVQTIGGGPEAVISTTSCTLGALKANAVMSNHRIW